MGRWLAILLSLFSGLSTIEVFPQSGELRYATLMFLRPRNEKGVHDQVYITIGNQRLFGIGSGQTVAYRIYSTGDIPVTVTVKGKKGEVSSFEGRTDVEVNNVYFFTVAPKSGFRQISKEEKEATISKTTVFIEKQEDLEHPIDRNSFMQPGAARGRSQGSCFLINAEGYVLTNYHVIKNAERIKVIGVQGSQGSSTEAIVVGTDEKMDIALLRFGSGRTTLPVPPYAFMPAKAVQQGESVVALGYPVKQVMGEEVKVTNGIINAKSGYKGAISEYQFSAAVQPGNSGGPLLNGEGQIIGMVTAKLNANVAESVGYALKADHLMFFLDQFEGVSYRKAEPTGAAQPLPQVVSTTAPFVYIIETE